MNNDSQKKISSSNVIFIIIFLGISYWVVDPLIESFLGSERPISDSIFNPTSREIWERFFVIFIFIVTGGLVDRILSRQRRTQKALRESEERFRLLYEDAPLAYQSLNDSGHIVKVNRAWLELLGYAEQEIIGRLFSDFVCSHEADKYQKAFLKIKHFHAMHGIELEMVHQNGSVITVAIDGKVGNNEMGSLRQFHCILHDVTERHRSEEALRRSEAKFRDLAELLPETIFECDISGKITFVNLSAIQTFQYSAEELAAGINIFQVIAPENRADAETNFKKLLEGKTSIGNEYIAVRKDGSRLPVTIRSTPIIQNNRPVGVRGFVIDISERVRVQKEIEESLSLLKATLESTADGILVVDSVGKISTFNHRFLEMWRIPDSIVAEKDDKKAIDFVLSQLKYPNVFVSKVMDLYSTPDLESNDILEFKDGRVFARYSRPQQINGVNCGRVWSFRDLTPQLKADESIRESEKMLQSVFSSIQDGLCVIDTSLDIIRLNGAAERLFNCGRLSAIGKKCHQVLYKRDGPCKDCLAARAIKTKQLQTGECRIANCAGEDRWLEIFLYPRLDDEGKSAGAIMFLRDITQDKLAKEALLENETKFRILFETANDGIHLMDGEIFIECNSKAVEIFGCNDKNDMIGHSPTDFSPPQQPDGRDSKEKALEYINAALNGKPQRFYWQHCRKDGAPIDVEVSLNALNIKRKTYLQAIERDISERKLVEQELRKNQSRLIDIIEGTNVGTWELNVQTGEANLDKRWAEMVGYTLEELAPISSRTWRDLVHPDDCKLSEEILQKHIAGELDYYDCDCRMKHKNGNWIWVHDRGRVVEWSDDGKPLRITGTHTDISDRKQAEQKLLESEEKYRITFDNTGTATVLVEADTTICLANMEFERLTGYSQQEIEGKMSWTKLVVKEDLERMLELNRLRREKNGKAPRNYEFGLITKSGEIRDIYITVDLIPNGSRSVVALLDITESKRIENELRRQKQQLADVIKGTNVGIWEWNVQTGYTCFNDRWAEIVGYTLEELAPISIETWLRLVHPDDAKISGDLLQKHFSHELDYYDCECRMKHKNGSWVWVHDRGQVVEWSDDGKPIRMTGTHTDITERKQAEEKLRAGEQRFRELAELLPETVYEMDLTGRITFANHTAFERFGYTIEDFEKGLNAFDMLIPEEREIAKEYTKRIMQGEIIDPVERTAVRKDGTTFPMIIQNVAVIRDGQVIGMRGVGFDITETKQTEQELKENKERYQALYNNAQVGLFRTRINDGKVLECNLSCAKMLGYDNIEECVAEYVTSEHYVDPGAREKMLEAIKATGEIKNFKTRFSRKNGSIFWSNFTAHIYPEKGFIEGVITDISDRIMAEQALRESEAKYRSIVENSADMIMLTYPNGRIAYVSPQCRKVLGFAENDILENRRFMVIHPADMERVKILHARALQGLSGSNEEYRIKTKNGETKHILHSWSPIFRDGQLQMIVSIVRDITERIQTEIALRESEERFRTIFETARDSIFMKNDRREYVSVNPVTEQLLGISIPQLLGHTDEDLFGEESGRHIKKTDDRVLSGEIVEDELSLMVRGGQRIFHVMKVPMRDGSGSIIGICGIVRDITEKRRMEEELIKTEKLESIGLLAGGIAHDFNNIMTAILGNISLARMYCDEDSDISKRLADAEKASLRAQDLTHQLLTFAKGGAPIKKAASIGQLIQETVEFVLRGSNVRCEFNMEKGLYPAEFDEGQISQAINNLVINAIQAMPDGGVITVAAQNLLIPDTASIPIRPGKAIKISIADQGSGISEQNLAKIFDPFFTTKKTGSGLGLASTYSIIKRHDGYIEVESQVNVGTTFHIYLPATDKILEEQMQTNRIVLSGNERILIMDDEEAIRIIASLALSDLGYIVTTAQNGFEAVKLYEEAFNAGEKFNIVIMDLTIPGSMGGKETIEKLKEFDPDIKAIVSSGFSEDPILSDFKKYGFCGYVPKPYNIQQLTQALREALSDSAVLQSPISL